MALIREWLSPSPAPGKGYGRDLAAMIRERFAASFNSSLQDEMNDTTLYFSIHTTFIKTQPPLNY
jgi:hypothetical protein